MERYLFMSDEMLSDKDIKKQEKELARLRKIQETKSNVNKPLTAYQAEYNEMAKKMEEKLNKKIGITENINENNKSKTKAKELLGGLQINPLVSKAEKRKKLAENINENHIYMKERYLLRLKESENPTLDEEEIKVKEPVKKDIKPYLKNIKHWQSYSQFPKPVLNHPSKSLKQNPSEKPKPSGLTSTQYQLGHKLFNK
jgi:hypothetical protein